MGVIVDVGTDDDDAVNMQHGAGEDAKMRVVMKVYISGVEGTGAGSYDIVQDEDGK